MRQIILDTETTGFYANHPSEPDRIVEIGCVELFNRKLTGNNLQFYLNPERDSNPGALEVHGLTTAFLSDKPKFAEIAQAFVDYVRGAEIIIHNAPFDLGFLDAELRRAGWAPMRSHVGGVIDTLAMAKELFPGKRNSLDALCDRLEVDRSGRTLHGALLDAELLADVYINLTRGQDALIMDVATPEVQAVTSVPMDLSGIALPVLSANAQELTAHDEVLGQIDKSSGGKTFWRRESAMA